MTDAITVSEAKEKITRRALAEKLGVQYGKITGFVNCMVAAGIIELTKEDEPDQKKAGKRAKMLLVPAKFEIKMS